MNTPELWKRKLMAFLHDPPEKAYDFTKQHIVRARAHMQSFNLGEWQEKNPDWTASAADRFVLPHGGIVSEKNVSFKHPCSGNVADLSFPDQGNAERFVGDSRPNFVEVDDLTCFWLVWRLWMEYAATHTDGQTKSAECLPYLPADTRVPDHSIWHHLSVTSAMETAKENPAFLLFQLGPVQEFIAQARSTRDLWSGSYLLSWLMAHAMLKVAEDLGPDCIIFPSLRGQPLFDWLNQNKLKQAKYEGSDSYWNYLMRDRRSFEDRVLTPNLPNRFLAVVPADYDPEPVVQALENEWCDISKACKKWMVQKGAGVLYEDRWDFQVANFWQVTWQVWPWVMNVKESLELFKTIPLGKESVLHLAYQIAHAIPKCEKDDRCYRGGELDAGWAWSAHYQLCQHRLDARRQTRDFKAWQGVDKAVKDDYSGKEESVISDKDNTWLKKAQPIRDLGFLFRKKQEHLGAANLIKRIWHKACLESKGLKRATESFDSVSAIAAAPWRNRFLIKLSESDDVQQASMAFQSLIKECADFLSFELPAREDHWFEDVDASVFHNSFWNNLKQTEQQKAQATQKALEDLVKRANVGKPSIYYAVFALDGDEMGKWISGEKTPLVKDILTGEAVNYFRKFPDGETWLETHRPISPAYHMQFSEALSNFALYCARRIVERHHGQLIYAGGDDVLAMLPAEEAIACAQGLHIAFQGGKLAERYPHQFAIAPDGFVRLKKESLSQSEPSWPLLVPGPKATVSVGLAMGHMKEPLQDMVQSAQAAEKRAKRDSTKGGFDRNALTINLFKRSGEQIEWGTNFTDEPFALLDFLNRGDTYKPPVDDQNKPMPISAKFPYRICELLRKYEPVGENFDWRAIAKCEVDWAINQLRIKDESIDQGLRDRVHAWLAKAPRLNDFYNLFAVEAFIARQGEE